MIYKQKTVSKPYLKPVKTLHKNEKKMTKKIKLAPQEKLKFVAKVSEIFLDKVVEHPEALITDLSKINDFKSFGVNYIEDSIGPGSQDGYYRFKQKKYYRNIDKAKNTKNDLGKVFEAKAHS